MSKLAIYVSTSHLSDPLFDPVVKQVQKVHDVVRKKCVTNIGDQIRHYWDHNVEAVVLLAPAANSIITQDSFDYTADKPITLGRYQWVQAVAAEEAGIPVYLLAIETDQDADQPGFYPLTNIKGTIDFDIGCCPFGEDRYLNMYEFENELEEAIKDYHHEHNPSVYKASGIPGILFDIVEFGDSWESYLKEMQKPFPQFTDYKFKYASPPEKTEQLIKPETAKKAKKNSKDTTEATKLKNTKLDLYSTLPDFGITLRKKRVKLKD